MWEMKAPIANNKPLRHRVCSAHLHRVGHGDNIETACGQDEPADPETEATQQRGPPNELGGTAAINSTCREGSAEETHLYPVGDRRR